MSRLIQLGVLAAVAAFAAGSAVSAAAAQYKWVGPDGRINYSDLAPPVEAEIVKGPGSSAAATPGDANLPYGLRMTVNKYPVTLFVMSKDCDPCKQARELLVKRGVPFSESLLRNNRDVEAFKKLGFDGQTLPAMSVGKQTTSGFEASVYNNLLDAAGYPKSSALPVNYVRTSAKPLAADEPPPADPVANNDGAGNAGDRPAGQATRRSLPAAPAPLPSRPAAIGADPNFRF